MSRPAAIARKRRLFVASMVVVGVMLVVGLVHMPGSSHSAPAGAAGTFPSAHADATMPPAYLAWMPGGFRPGSGEPPDGTPRPPRVRRCDRHQRT